MKMRSRYNVDFTVRKTDKDLELKNLADEEDGRCGPCLPWALQRGEAV